MASLILFNLNSEAGRVEHTRCMCRLISFSKSSLISRNGDYGKLKFEKGRSERFCEHGMAWR